MAAMPISSMQWETMAAIVELSDRISALLQPGWSYSLAKFLLRDKIFKPLQKMGNGCSKDTLKEQFIICPILQK
jgi:hypothetical protein